VTVGGGRVGGDGVSWTGFTAVEQREEIDDLLVALRRLRHRLDPLPHLKYPSHR